MIEDIKGYQPHNQEKIDTVNKIKELETEFGKFLNQLEEKLSGQYLENAQLSDISEKTLDESYERTHQIQVAKDKLKEASMWACRAVFAPDEPY